MQAPGAHGKCYSALAWFQDADPPSMVDMEYTHPCEPYIVALSAALPRYDERFRGRYQDKVEQLAHMAAWGFEWRLLPAHFVLHLPHEKTAVFHKEPWDTVAAPKALLKVMLQEAAAQPEFVQTVPVQA